MCSTSKTTEHQLDNKTYTKLRVHQTYITKLILISTYLCVPCCSTTNEKEKRCLCFVFTRLGLYMLLY